MTYIKSYGVYIPAYGIADNVLSPKGRAKYHAIGYVDEDIITMAYAAIENMDFEVFVRESIDAILFATTTPVFNDRYHASYLADLCGLQQGILALDLSTTNRSGTDALILADTLISSGKSKNVLVVASDISFPSIGKEVRTPFGHGAVAVIVSMEKTSIELTRAESYSEAVAEEFVYKREKVKYDPRFARTAGFKHNMNAVLTGLHPSEIKSLIINSAYVKLILGALKKKGFDLQGQLAPDTLIPIIGYCGVAHGLLRLIYAIETVKGRSVLVDYNNGSNVIWIDVSLEKKLSTSYDISAIQASDMQSIDNYQDYLAIRKQCNFTGRGYKSIEMYSSEIMQEREKDQLLYLNAFKCESCDTVYYIQSNRCNNCKETQFSKVTLSRKGVVYSRTSEHYFPSSFQPINMIVVDLNGGGRMTIQQTDDMYPNKRSVINIGDNVQLVLRKMMENDKKPNYFWKCVLIDRNTADS